MTTSTADPPESLPAGWRSRVPVSTLGRHGRSLTMLQGDHAAMCRWIAHYDKQKDSERDIAAKHHRNRQYPKQPDANKEPIRR